MMPLDPSSNTKLSGEAIILPECSRPGSSLAERLFPSEESEEDQIQRAFVTVSDVRENSQAVIIGDSDDTARENEKPLSAKVMFASKALLEHGVTYERLQHLPGLDKVAFFRHTEAP
jgi:hypothetical protein